METKNILKQRVSIYLFKSYYVVWKLTSLIMYASFSSGLNRTMQYGNSALLVWNGIIFCRLNRTMQYGNHFLLCMRGLLLSCLNRTMQYGNFLFSIVVVLYFSQFKSYYVVWKHIVSGEVTSVFPEFKSYYVVWKLQKQKGNQKQRPSLNRTMQYGNFFVLFFVLSSGLWFKSYYVVWKLYIYKIYIITDKEV